MDVARGRHSARLDPAEHSGLVVFLLGARINRWSRPQDWLPVVKAMPPMLRELDEHPEYGLLRRDGYFTGRRILSVQYWRDFESLTRWARASDHEHLPGWRLFNQLARRTDSVGVYHETFVVGAAGSEAVYVDMPPFGLAAATEHVPVATRGESAARRMGVTDRDDVAAEAYAPES